MKKYLIFISLLLTLLLISSSALAASDALDTLQKNVTMAFNWGLGIASMLAAISFAFGAIQYMLSKVVEGKERMIGSVLGLVLILTSWLILQTVNPQLVSLELDPLPAGAGIYMLKNGDKNDLSHVADMSVADLTELKEQGYTKIYYKCLDKNTAPELFIWSYKKTNQEYDFETEGNNNFTIITCGIEEDISGWVSYKMSFIKPGAYFCTGSGCNYCSEVYTTSQKDIPAPFAGKLGSILLVNKKISENSHGMGVILHENPDFTKGGSCGYKPIFYSADSARKYMFTCEKSVLESAHSADIFYVARDGKLSGSGIGFYSSTTGWKAGVWGGSFLLTPDEINRERIILNPKEDMEFDWSGDDEKKTNEEQKTFKEACPDFGTCIDPRSMQVNGNYLVTIYTHPTPVTGNEIWCQSFTKDVESFGAQSEIKPEGGSNYEINRVEIIPTIAD